MAEKMVVSMRFHMDNSEDRKLYEFLKQDAGDVMSLAAVAKGRIRDSYHAEKRMRTSIATGTTAKKTCTSARTIMLQSSATRILRKLPMP